MRRSGLTCAAALALLLASPIAAREIHVDCAREHQSVMIDADSDRNFIQLMWSEGVAEEYTQGDGYVSGPDSKGRTEKVTYLVDFGKDSVAFGQDRICTPESIAAGCRDKRLRNTLDLSSGLLKYEDQESTIMLKCKEAPPGRRF